MQVGERVEDEGERERSQHVKTLGNKLPPLDSRRAFSCKEDAGQDSLELRRLRQDIPFYHNLIIFYRPREMFATFTLTLGPDELVQVKDNQLNKARLVWRKNTSRLTTNHLRHLITTLAFLGY